MSRVYSQCMFNQEVYGSVTNLAPESFVTVLRDLAFYLIPIGAPITVGITVGDLAVASYTGEGLVAELHHESRRIVIEPGSSWTVETTSPVQVYISGYALSLP